MNICDERHEPKYHIIYKSATCGGYHPEWLVCESCMANRNCFGSDQEIETMRILA